MSSTKNFDSTPQIPIPFFQAQVAFWSLFFILLACLGIYWLAKRVGVF